MAVCGPVHGGTAVAKPRLQRSYDNMEEIERKSASEKKRIKIQRNREK